MLTAIFTCLVLVVATVLIHYEGLRLVPPVTSPIRGRRKVALTVLWIFAIHLVEILLYALAYWLLDAVLGVGSFQGTREQMQFDYIYFSAETYTALGLGDIFPVGPLRLVTAIEALNGLVLIGWSASFTFLVMQRHWELRRNGR